MLLVELLRTVGIKLKRRFASEHGQKHLDFFPVFGNLLDRSNVTLEGSALHGYAVADLIVELYLAGIDADCRNLLVGERNGL